MSKVGVSALSILQQRTLDQERPGDDIVVNHVHPGWVPNRKKKHVAAEPEPPVAGFFSVAAANFSYFDFLQP